MRNLSHDRQQVLVLIIGLLLCSLTFIVGTTALTAGLKQLKKGYR